MTHHSALEPRRARGVTQHAVARLGDTLESTDVGVVYCKGAALRLPVGPAAAAARHPIVSRSRVARVVQIPCALAAAFTMAGAPAELLVDASGLTWYSMAERSKSFLESIRDDTPVANLELSR